MSAGVYLTFMVSEFLIVFCTVTTVQGSDDAICLSPNPLDHDVIFGTCYLKLVVP